MAEPQSRAARVREIAGVFLRLGIVGFGGPAVHIAMMRHELVTRRKWVDDTAFLDLVGATHLIPGPNSTELAIHLGWHRAGWRGLVVAGVCFIVPASLLVGLLAAWYVEHGTTPAFTSLLAGVVPAVLGIVLAALVPLLGALRARWLSLVIVVLVVIGQILGAGELMLLAAGAIIGLAPVAYRRLVASDFKGRGPLGIVSALLVVVPGSGGHDLGTLFLSMLKIGAVLYGSGYVLLAFLRSDFVVRLGWLSDAELMDAIAIGQVTPGPVFTTATFVGQVVAGPPGAVLATVAIFLPSFCFVALLTRVTGRLRDSVWTAGLLDGVNAASVALLVSVSWALGRQTVTSWSAVALCLVSALLCRFTSLNSAWLVAFGAAIGIVFL